MFYTGNFVRCKMVVQMESWDNIWTGIEFKVNKTSAYLEYSCSVHRLVLQNFLLFKLLLLELFIS